MKIEKFIKTSPICGIYAAYHSTISELQTRLLDQEGIHFLQALTLVAIFFEERSVRPTELSHSLEVSSSNLSHSLRGLEKMDLVQRSLLKTDARAYTFSLTGVGRRKALRLIKLFDSLQGKIEAAGGRELNPELKRFVQIYEDCKI